MLVVGTWESEEVSPADVGVGKEGLLLSRIAQNGAASMVRECVCVGKDWAGGCALSTTHRDRVPSASGQVRTGTSAITASALVQTLPAKCARDSLLLRRLSTSRVSRPFRPSFLGLCHWDTGPTEVSTARCFPVAPGS